MRFKLFMLSIVAAILPAVAQNASVSGRVVDSYTGAPIAGATVMLREQGLSAVTGPSGDFTITKAKSGQDWLQTIAFGYADVEEEVTLPNRGNINLGNIKLTNSDNLSDYYEENQDMLFDEQALDDDENGSQTITSLTGASDNIYYNAANYDFSVMYFRFRGYDSQYQTTYINSLDMNDPIRGRFNYSSLGGMTSRAFRNRTTTIGLGASNYGFGSVGGSSNISTITQDYSPGFNGSLAYTNSNYMLRAMATYSTGINKNGWGLTISGIGRYAHEGVIKGTFYNSVGLFLSTQKIFNRNHSLTLTAWAAPTQRATASATYQEAYDLAGSNLYNPNWGWYDGKKRSARVVESWDPTAMLTWLYKSDKGTTITTSAMFRSVNYSTSALNWYNALDPRPDYYRNLPSNFLQDGEPTTQSEYVANLWRTDESVRQLNWDRMYLVNELNNQQNVGKSDADKVGSSYILEKRHSNNLQVQIGSVLDTRLNSIMTMQAGLNASYTKATYYKTIKDLMGGEFWVDIDPFSDREITLAPDLLQNNLDDPNRRVTKGDKFGYWYNIHAAKVGGFLQNKITLPHWDIDYGLEMSYLQFHRYGHWRNGRAPENSKGKGKIHRFDDAAFKAGATYKIDGRNYIMAHASYGSYAPMIESVYVSPRIEDTAIDNEQSERILSGDITYGWNYRKFRGSVTAYWTEFYNATERTSFYDDNYSSFVNYVLADVHRQNRGIEIGLAYKIIPSLTASFAGTIASYRYKNNPEGTRSFENGLRPDTTQTIYLKNYRVGGTPQMAFNLGLDYAAPKSWFFAVNATWLREAYVKFAPAYHEAQPTLWQSYPDQAQAIAKQEEISRQSKLHNAFVLNASIGKMLYINRKVALNFNLNIDNILNNKNIQNNGYQQGRIDRTNWDMSKYPNKYTYAQGIKVFFNVGVRF